MSFLLRKTQRNGKKIAHRHDNFWYKKYMDITKEGKSEGAINPPPLIPAGTKYGCT